jgi:hypothetical protein
MDNETSGAAVAPESAAARLARWAQKLLDLSARNRLLNCAKSAQVAPLVAGDLARLEDALADNGKFAIIGADKFSAAEFADDKNARDLAQQIRDAAGAKPLTDAAREILLAAQQRRRLVSPLAENELGKNLLKIYRQARADLEDGGINTLFLTLGVLDWTQDQKTYSAPLILLPAVITRPTVVEPARLSILDEDPLLNVTLIE